MEQRITLVTLGVSDYPLAKAFYEALGWSAAMEIQETAFFQANGSILVLWGREKLAEDMGLADDGARWAGIALAHNVASRDEVHQVIEQARSNGAEIAREPSETFYGGYAGVFLDLDGHPWEVAHNPGFGLDDGGNVVLPSTAVRCPQAGFTHEARGRNSHRALTGGPLSCAHGDPAAGRR